MSRQPVSMRQATIGDVPFLVELWSDVLRRADRQEQVHDLEIIVKEAAESAERRLLVAEYDGEPAGAVLLRVTPMTPLNLEPTVQALAAHVTPSFRGKGIGSALMEAAVLWAEDLGIGHLTTAAPSSSRSGNRFMARLSLGPQAVFRASIDPAGPRQAGGAPAEQCADHRADGRPPPPRPGAGRAPPAEQADHRGHRHVLTVRARLCRSASTSGARRVSVPPLGGRVTDGSARLLLLDGHSLAYRAFFALPLENFSTTTGQPTNAVFGFTSMLINVLRDERPTHIARRLRRVPADLPAGGVRRIQGRPQQDARRVLQPAAPHRGGADRDADPLPQEGGLRGRRHHRHPRDPGQGRRVRGPHLLGRPRLLPARRRRAPPSSTRCAGCPR